MILENLNQLALEAQQQFNSYQKQEIILNPEFKDKFKDCITESIMYSKFTSVIKTSSNLTITFPNQWFIIASYFVKYLVALKVYKRNYQSIFEYTENAKELVKNMKESSTIPPFLLTRIDSHFDEERDKENFKKFLSDYNWWFGNKTIDRGDYFVSPILNLAKVVNVSQSYIADLTYILSEHTFLLPLLQESIITNNVPQLNVSDLINLDVNKFQKDAVIANFRISENLALRFIASLLTKPFVILTGLSGSGKTKLAQAFAMWISENESQYCIVPVGADWTNREPLLGFPNSLNAGEYIKPDNRVLDVIIEASKNQSKPFFLILDEMNLSHVERYFADFLSVMESQREICLHSGNTNWGDVPSKITLPKNLFIVGTVNIDETTYMFSPKVLDRANVIEFRVTSDEMEEFLINNGPLDLDSLISCGRNLAESFTNIINNPILETTNEAELKETLIQFFDELKKTGAEFGYRTAAEILRFNAVINNLEVDWTIPQIIDAAIMQKLLPKVHGSRRKLEPVLKTLAKLCLNDEKELDNYLSGKKEVISEDIEVKYPLSLEKIIRMNQNLLNNGFTSYAEA